MVEEKACAQSSGWISSDGSDDDDQTKPARARRGKGDKAKAAVAKGKGKRRQRPAAKGCDDDEEEEGDVKEPKRKSKRRPGNASASSSPSLELPPAYDTLLKLYDAVDTVCCFLLKNKLPCTLTNVESMTKVFFSVEGLARVCAVCSEAISFHYVPLLGQEDCEQSDYSLELTFPTAGGIGKSHGRRRREMVRRGLVSAALMRHEDFLADRKKEEGEGHQAWDVTQQGWHPGFHHTHVDITPIELPYKPTVLAEAPSTDPYVAPPAPLVKPGTTGMAPAVVNTIMMEADTMLSPFNENFLNNIPAEDVPEDDSQCVTLDGVLCYLKTLAFYRDQVVHVEEFPPSEPQYGAIDQDLPGPLQAALETKGIHRFFHHQAQAINAVIKGSHIAIATATSSGKSIVYNIPVLRSILADGQRSTALYLFPTKALAQDQLRSLTELLGCHPELACRVHVSTYDGDTPHVERSDIRNGSSIILSNPDMLHASILPQHTFWKHFLSNLRFVVVDEAHMYTGTFGAHVANVIRRLVRLCLLYDNPGPQFICCSATIYNPAEHFAALIPVNCLGGGDRLTLITQDTSPRGRKVFAIWNPPIKQSHTRQPSMVAPRPRQWRLFRLQQRQPSPSSAVEEDSEESHQAAWEEEQAQAIEASSQVEGFVVAGAADPERVQQQQEQDNKEKGEGDEGEAEAYDGHDIMSVEEEDGNASNFGPRRRSAIVETAMLFSALIKQRIRTLAFCKVRKLVEMVLRYTLQDLHATAPALAPLVKGYRGGYTKQARREIERELFAGSLLGVTATCALELGVDVGNLDATVHMGFPGAISSLWQQAGRAGRAGRDSVAFLVCFETPVDQHFARHPEELFEMRPESAVMDHTNAYVLRGQLLCAAKEEPLGRVYHSGITDRDLFGANSKSYGEAIRYLREAGSLAAPEADGCWRPKDWIDKPWRDVNLRMIDPITFEVCDLSRENEVIDHVGYTRAFFELFEGAIYMHQARQYLVVRLDIEKHKAMVRPVRVGYYTSSRNHTDVNIIHKLESTPDGRISSGYAQIVAKVWGYRKIWLQTGKIFEMGLFSLPPLEYETRAFFIDLDPEIQREVTEAGLCYLAGIHSVNHALLAVTPLFLLCDATDVDTEHVYPFQQRPRPPRIVVYDKRPGGIGAAESLFNCIDEVLVKMKALVDGCPCEESVGCPGCLHDYRCSDYNVVLDKKAAQIIIGCILERRRASTRGTCSPGPRSTGGMALEEEQGREEKKPTPRKEARDRALRIARSMDQARSKDMALQRSWAESFPNFRPEE